MSLPNVAFAASAAHTGYGDGLFISVDGTLFNQVMATQNMQYQGQKNNYEDVTTTTSPSNPGSSVPSLENLIVSEDPGTFTFDVVFDPSDVGQIALDAAYAAKTKLTVKHVYKALAGQTTGPINAFTATVESFAQPGSNATSGTKRSCSLKISGPITKTPAVPVSSGS